MHFARASLVLCLAVSASACVLGRATVYRPGGAAGAPQERAGRGSFAPQGMASTVWMPFTPRLEQVNNRTNEGARVTSVSGLTTYGVYRYLAVFHEFEQGIPGDLIGQLDGLVDEFIDGLDQSGEVVAGDAIWLSGFPGTQVELHVNPGNGQPPQRIVVRQYIGRRRAYLFAFGSPVANATVATPFEAQYFDSIRLDPTDAPSPAGDGSLDFQNFGWVYPPEGSFAALMPGAPRREDGTLTVGDDSLITRTFIARATNGSAMWVRTVPRGGAEGIDVLATVRAQILTLGTLRSERPADRRGYGGTALVIDTADSVVYALVLLTPGGVYEVVHVAPRANDAEQTEHRRRFFNSFHIL